MSGITFTFRFICVSGCVAGIANVDLKSTTTAAAAAAAAASWCWWSLKRYTATAVHTDWESAVSAIPPKIHKYTFHSWSHHQLSALHFNTNRIEISCVSFDGSVGRSVYFSCSLYMHISGVNFVVVAVVVVFHFFSVHFFVFHFYISLFLSCCCCALLFIGVERKNENERGFRHLYVLCARARPSVLARCHVSYLYYINFPLHLWLKSGFHVSSRPPPFAAVLYINYYVMNCVFVVHLCHWQFVGDGMPWSCFYFYFHTDEKQLSHRFNPQSAWASSCSCVCVCNGGFSPPCACVLFVRCNLFRYNHLIHCRQDWSFYGWNSMRNRIP